MMINYRLFLNSSFRHHNVYFLKLWNVLQARDDSHQHTHYFSCQKVYSQLGPWISDTVLYDNSSNYSLKQVRTCINSTLGRPRGCSGPKERIFNYFWIGDNLTFVQARNNCHSMGAKLYDLIDGKIERIDFLLVHMLPIHTFWVGIELNNDYKWNSWINEDRQNMIGQLGTYGVSTESDKYVAISYTYRSDKDTPFNAGVRKNENETLPSVCYRIDNGENF